MPPCRKPNAKFDGMKLHGSARPGDAEMMRAELAKALWKAGNFLRTATSPDAPIQPTASRCRIKYFIGIWMVADGPPLGSSLCPGTRKPEKRAHARPCGAQRPFARGQGGGVKA